MQNKIKEVCARLEETLLAKNADYGNSFAASRLTNTTTRERILIRLEDKFSRLASLSQREPAFESLDDTILDIAGYCVLFLCSEG